MSTPLSHTSSKIIDESRPFPPRFHWLKRLSLFGVVLFIALGGLRVWWGHESQRRIDAMVADAHAHGQPILPEDFAPREIPDSDNAAIIYKQADRTMSWNTVEINFWPNEPYSNSDLQFISRMLSAHTAELQLMRQARARHDAEWGYHVIPPFIRLRPPHRLRYGSDLVHLLMFVARYEHAFQDDASAIEYARDELAFGNASAASTTDLFDMFNAQGIETAGVATIIEIAPTLNIEQPGAKSRGSATHEQVRGMIADLLDETRFRQSATRAWAGEQMMVIATEPELVNSEIHPVVIADMAWPVFQLQSYRAALRLGAVIAAAGQGNYPAAEGMMPIEDDRENASTLELLVRKDAMRASQTRYVSLIYQLSAMRRVAATLLAVDLYESDHGGRLPETLADLAPAYLQAVPIDLFSPAHQTLRYLPHRDPPAIYSVGYNGTDEGGSSRPLHPNSGYVWDAEDAVFPLRPASATTQPAGGTE